MRISELKPGDEFSVRAKFIGSTRDDIYNRRVEINRATVYLYTDTEVEKVYPRALKVGDRVRSLLGSVPIVYSLVFIDPETSQVVLKESSGKGLYINYLQYLELDKSENS